MTEAARVGALVAQATGRVATETRPLTGGDICEAWRVDTSDGPLFAKTLADAPEEFFATEAAALAWLAGPGFVPVPGVVGHSRDVLVLDFVDSTRPTRDTQENFGRGLARLHAAGAAGFGAVPPGGGTAGFLARLGIADRTVATWSEFFATQRLEPLGAEAHDRNVLPEGTRTRLDHLAERLLGGDGDLTGPAEPFARLHGDLWGGNVLWGADGQGWLIDPAAHGGHRESDLAMMRLFGGFDDVVFDAYDEQAPLAEGWEHRVELHQLPPLLVHACLFGGSYGLAVDRVVRRYG